MKFCCTILPLRSLLLFCLLSFLSFHQFAQTSATSSPYSRFALGRPENTGFASITAFGGSYTAYHNDTTYSSTFFINQGNPASYAFTKLTTYEFGARYGYYTFTGQDAAVKKQNGGFNYISLAFPIRKKAGVAFGLLPFSNVGYEVTTKTEYVDSIGTLSTNYRGSGGVNQVYAGIGYRPFEARYRNLQRLPSYKTLDSLGNKALMRRKRFFADALSTLSVGANVSYLYGTIDYATRKYFPTSFGANFNTCDQVETVLHDVYFQAGAQMTFNINSVKNRSKGKDSSSIASPYRDLKKKWHITLGYSASLPKAVSTNASHLAYSFTLLSFNRELPNDTFANSSIKGTVNLPFMQSFGVCAKRSESLWLFADIGMQQWSKFSFLGENQGLNNQIRYSGGLQWQPSRNSIGTGSYFKRTYYRLGGRYNTGYLFLKGNHISEYAVSAGLGLPVGRYKVFTVVNLTAEYGMAGTTNNRLIQEKFLRFVIGLTFNDRWFIKPKYD